MSAPRYSFEAINQLAQGDTGHFVFLDSWSISLLDSMLSQNMPLWFWMNEQNPLTEAEIDDLDNRLATAGGQLMQSLVGLIMPVCTFALPEGTLLCDGSTYLRADYPNLYDAIDPGLRIDAASFITPDLRDRFVLAAGSHAAYTSGGSFEHVQSAAELAAHIHTTQPHNHSDTPHTHAEGIAVPSVADFGTGAPVPSAVPGVGITGPASVGILPATVSVDSAGSSDPMDITPPFYALKYVVVAL